MLAMMATIMSSGSPNTGVRAEDIDTSPKEKITPKGCKKYVFKESFGTLEVIAINDKSAIAKHWIEGVEIKMSRTLRKSKSHINQ